MIAVGDEWRFGFEDAGRKLLGPGWSTEPDWSWSTGEQATLALPVPPGEGELLLELDISPCVAAPRLPTQALRVSVAQITIDARRIGGAARLLLPIPRAAERPGSIAVTLHHPDAASPRALGLNADPRRLGMRLSRAQLIRAPRDPPRRPGPYALAQTMQFGWRGSGPEWLEAGWDVPEGDHAWAAGTHCTLRIEGGKPGADHLLLLDLLPFTEPPLMPRQRMLIGANDRLLLILALDRRTIIALPLPRLPEGETAWRLSFDNLDAAAPRDFGRLPDGRNRAFMLMWAWLIRTAPLAEQTGTKTALPPAELLGRFESLGHACDFGQLQRNLGNERLGLLHLAGISTVGLTHGLMDGFRQLGRADRIEVTPRDDGPNAWFHDRTYHLSGPTGIAWNAAAPAAVRRQAARTLPFLKQRLLEEIAGGERIFILRRPETLLAVEVAAVQAALLLHGDVTLLWLVQDGSMPPGAVRRLGPRLLQGGLDRPEAADGTPAWHAVLAAAWTLAGR